MQTIRANVDLPRVNKQFNWVVSALLASPTQNPAKWKDFIAYTKKEYSGVIQHNFTPRVFMSIQIAEFGQMRGTDYHDRRFTMDPKGVYRFKETLQKVYDEFQTQNLYFYDNGKLRLNQELSKDMTYTIPVGDKTIKIAYATIKDEDHEINDFEGIVIFVNNYHIYMTLTYLELGFMLDEIKKLNLAQMGLDLICSVM